MRIGALLLAAGLSTRFGDTKLLATLYNGSTVFAQTYDRLSAAIEDVVVITRPELANALKLHGTQIQIFANAHEGIGATLAFGIQFATHWDACFVCLGDMPFVSTATYSRLLESADPNLIVVPEYNGTRGNPVVFGGMHFNSLTKLRGDSGGKLILAERSNHLRLIQVADPAVLMDIDTPEDLATLQTP